MPAATIQSVDRAAQILEAVAGSEAGATLRELVDQLGLHASTLHHLAQTLVQRHMLIQSTDTKRYRIGPTVMEWAAAAQRGQDFQAIDACIRRIAERLPAATIVFCQLLAGEVVAVRRVSPDRSGVIEQPHHRVMSPYTSSCALAIQAFCPADERARYQKRHPFDDYGSHHWPTRDGLDTFLTDARRRAVVLGPWTAESSRAAIPVVSPRKELIGVIGTSITRDDHDDDLHEHIAQTLLDEVAAGGFVRFDMHKEQVT
jgi:IclR family acetate operon transcriptional repressor